MMETKVVPLNVWGRWSKPGEEDRWIRKYVLAGETEKAYKIEEHAKPNPKHLRELSPEFQALVQKLAKPEIIWLPKSQVKLEGNVLQVPEWLFTEKFAPADAEFVAQEGE